MVDVMFELYRFKDTSIKAREVAEKYGLWWILIDYYETTGFMLTPRGRMSLKDFFNRVLQVYNEMKDYVQRVYIHARFRVPQSEYDSVKDCVGKLNAIVHRGFYYIVEVDRVVHEEELSKLPEYLQCLIKLAGVSR